MTKKSSIKIRVDDDSDAIKIENDWITEADEDLHSLNLTRARSKWSSTNSAAVLGANYFPAASVNAER